MFSKTSGLETETMCYKTGLAKNENGPINTPPTCGSVSPNARCSDGQCCSSSGLCGPIADSDGQYRIAGNVVPYAEAVNKFCAQNQGDYRLYPCDTVCAIGSDGCPCTIGYGCDPGNVCELSTQTCKATQATSDARSSTFYLLSSFVLAASLMFATIFG